LLPILGERVSASTVSRVSRVLDAEVEAFHDKVRVGDWEEVKRDLRRIYGAKNRMRAIQAAIRFGDRWDGLYHAAVRCLMKDLDELLNHYDLKESEWQRMSRTTNAIERRFREVRRRTRPMGAFIRAVRTPRPGDCGVLCGSNESPLGDTARSRS
jgi:transposase-like protein